MQRFFDTLVTIFGVLRITLADEDHDLAAVGQRLFDQIAGLLACRVIVCAEIAGAVALRRVAVLCKDQRLPGDVVEQLCLVGRIDRRDGDAVYAAGEQVVNDALLFGGGAFAGNLEFHVNVVEFFVGLFAAALGDCPEVGGVVGHESQLLLLAAGRAAEQQEGDEHAGKQSGVKGEFHAFPLV